MHLSVRCECEQYNNQLPVKKMQRAKEDDRLPESEKNVSERNLLFFVCRSSVTTFPLGNGSESFKKKCCGKKLSLPSSTFCSNKVMIMIVSAKFPVPSY